MLPIVRKLYRRVPDSRWEVSPDRSEITIATDSATITLPARLAQSLREFDQPIDMEAFVDSVSRSDEARREWEELLARLIAMGILERRLLGADRSRKSIYSKSNRKSAELVYVFSGLRGNMGMGTDALSFVRAADLLRKNFALLRDLARSRYRRGVSQEIPDFPSLLAWMKEFREGLPHVERVHCAGNSMGAGTAMMAGHYLGMDSVVAFSLPWLDNPAAVDDDDGIEWDLRKLLATWNGKTQYFVYYSKDNEHDAANAVQLDGFPGVHLRPLDAAEHNVIPRLAKSGELSAHFAATTR